MYQFMDKTIEDHILPISYYCYLQAETSKYIKNYMYYNKLDN